MYRKMIDDHMKLIVEKKKEKEKKRIKKGRKFLPKKLIILELMKTTLRPTFE